MRINPMKPKARVPDPRAAFQAKANALVRSGEAADFCHACSILARRRRRPNRLTGQPKLTPTGLPLVTDDPATRAARRRIDSRYERQD